MLRTAGRNFIAAAAAVGLIGTGMAQQAAPPAADDSGPPIMVRGYPPRCHPRPDDPQDAASAAAPAAAKWLRIEPDPASGGFRHVEGIGLGKDRLTAPGEWQRAGTALPDFVFRVPADGAPLCIGARKRSPRGWVQLQQMLHVAPFRCRHVRFTAFVAARRAEVLLWLNDGERHPVEMRFDGSHEWTPVKLEQGVVDITNAWVGFGVGLGSGDVWFYQPRIETIPDAQLAPAQLKAQKECEKRLDMYRRLAPDKPLPN